jgi:hypothetical protein
MSNELADVARAFKPPKQIKPAPSYFDWVHNNIKIKANNVPAIS